MTDFSLLRNSNWMTCVHAAVFWCLLAVCSLKSKSRAFMISSWCLYKASLVAASPSLHRPQYLSISQNTSCRNGCSAVESFKNLHHGIHGPFVQHHLTTYNLHTISFLAIAFQKSAISNALWKVLCAATKRRIRVLWSVRRSDVNRHDQKHEEDLPIAQNRSTGISSMLWSMSLA